VHPSAHPSASVAARAYWPAEAERWLFAREPLGMHFGLERMERLMAELGDPQRTFRSIHVVGTNGKSSTVRMTAAILRRHGLRTGAYLSPHLRSFVERIAVEEQAIGEDAFAAAVARVAAAAELVDADRSSRRSPPPRTSPSPSSTSRSPSSTPASAAGSTRRP
jgi:hypothetical protein